MIYKMLHLIWAAGTLAGLSFLKELDQQGIALYFILSICLFGLSNWVLTRRLLKAVKELEPDNEENIRDFFVNTKKNRALLRSDVPEVQKKIRDYLSIKPYGLFLAGLLIFVMIYRIYMK